MKPSSSSANSHCALALFGCCCSPPSYLPRLLPCRRCHRADLYVQSHHSAWTSCTLISRSVRPFWLRNDQVRLALYLKFSCQAMKTTCSLCSLVGLSHTPRTSSSPPFPVAFLHPNHHSGEIFASTQFKIPTTDPLNKLSAVGKIVQFVDFGVRG
jgi:hypothetical protein